MTKGIPDPIELTTRLPSWVPKFSLVVPTYNVADYIDEFLASVFSQTSKTQRFEVIIVDDGSTDGSGKIALEWAKKYPDQMRYIRQENCGLSQARNTGLRAARGAWVSFPDPDDFLDADYFRVMLEQTVVPHDNPVLMIVSKLLPYDEATQTSHDNHPLDYKFQDGLNYVDTSDLGDFLHLSAASAWFDRETLVKHKLRFNPRVKPVFEDGHLVSKLLMLCPDRTIAVVPDAVYHYRKRADASSLVGGAKTTKGFYLDAVEYGYLDLILFAKAKLGRVPHFVQRVCLYELQSRIKHLVARPDADNILTPTEFARFSGLVERVFQDIDLETIQEFQVGRFDNQQRIALIARFKSQMAISPYLYIESFDVRTGLARFSYFVGSGSRPEVTITTPSRTIAQRQVSEQWTSFGGEDFLGQVWFYIKVPKTGRISCEMAGKPLEIRQGRRSLAEPLGHASLAAFMFDFVPRGLTTDQRRLRKVLDRDQSRDFDAACLLMDTAMLAGGDAESLYRHLMHKGRTKNLWFVLSVKSPDWGRLMAQGFRLLPYGSQAHSRALAQGNVLVTSCADAAHYWPNGPETYRGLSRLRTVVLPQPDALRKKGIDYICAAGTSVAEYLTQSDYAPKWFPSEVLVTGHPRHDEIALRPNRPKSIVFVPDWLMDVSQASGHNGFSPAPLPKAAVTRFHAFWDDLLTEPELAALKDDHDLEYLLLTGWNMARDDKFRHLGRTKIFYPGETADLMSDGISDAAVVVTDRLETAMDAAYVGSDVLFTGPPPRAPLPPQICVTPTKADVLRQLSGLVRIKRDRAKISRPRPFFPKDKKSACERVLAQLDKIDALPDHQPDDVAK